MRNVRERTFTARVAQQFQAPPILINSGAPKQPVMFPQIRISWPLVVAVAVIALFWMVSFPLADAGRDIANRVFLRPMENVMRRMW